MKNFEVIEKFENFELGEITIRDEYGRVVRTRFIVMRDGTRIGAEFEKLEEAEVLFRKIRSDLNE